METKIYRDGETADGREVREVDRDKKGEVQKDGY